MSSHIRPDIRKENDKKKEHQPSEPSTPPEEVKNIYTIISISWRRPAWPKAWWIKRSKVRHPPLLSRNQPPFTSYTKCLQRIYKFGLLRISCRQDSRSLWRVLSYVCADTELDRTAYGSNDRMNEFEAMIEKWIECCHSISKWILANKFSCLANKSLY